MIGKLLLAMLIVEVAAVVPMVTKAALRPTVPVVAEHEDEHNRHARRRRAKLFT